LLIFADGYLRANGKSLVLETLLRYSYRIGNFAQNGS
jgi:hypothetical protein